MGQTEKEVALEALKLAITLYSTYAKTKGATEEELDAIYDQSKSQFLTNDPSNLEDIS